MSFCAARGGQGLTMLTAHEIVVEANGSEIPVGIDRETVMMPTPVRWPSGRRRCGSGYPEIAGTCPPKPAIDWPTQRQLASFRALPQGTG